LLAAEGVGTNEIVAQVGVSKPTVIAWMKRYAAEGLGGLDDRPNPGRPRTVDEMAIVQATLEPPPERLGVTHWSARLLAAHLGVSNYTIARVWQRWGSSRGGGRRSSSPPTPSWRRRSAMSSACISIRRRRQSCCAWTRSPISSQAPFCVNPPSAAGS
jgi:Homeodomain-like domain